MTLKIFLQKIKGIKKIPQHQSLCNLKIHHWLKYSSKTFLKRSADLMLTISLRDSRKLCSKLALCHLKFESHRNIIHGKREWACSWWRVRTVLPHVGKGSLRSKRFRASSSRKVGTRAKKKKEWQGRGKKEKLARKPRKSKPRFVSFLKWKDSFCLLEI